MSTIQIDRLADTVVKQDASDLHLDCGKKSTPALNGKLRNLDN